MVVNSHSSRDACTSSPREEGRPPHLIWRKTTWTQGVDGIRGGASQGKQEDGDKTKSTTLKLLLKIFTDKSFPPLKSFGPFTYPNVPFWPPPLMWTLHEVNSICTESNGISASVCECVRVFYRTVLLAQNQAVPSKPYLLYFCLSLLFGVFTNKRKGGKLWRPWPAAGTQYFRTALPTPDINFTPQLAFTHSALPYV